MLWTLTKAFRCRCFFLLSHTQQRRKCWKITWSKCDRNTIRDKCWCVWQGFPIKPTLFSLVSLSLLLSSFDLCIYLSCCVRTHLVLLVGNAVLLSMLILSEQIDYRSRQKKWASLFKGNRSSHLCELNKQQRHKVHTTKKKCLLQT